MFVLFYTNDFYFCFAISWVRTAMTNSGERRELIYNLLSMICDNMWVKDHGLWITDRVPRTLRYQNISFSKIDIASIAEKFSAVNINSAKFQKIKFYWRF